MLRVAEIMVPDPVVVLPGTTLRDAARIMHERNINSLLVSEDDHVAGIITSRDLVQRVATGGVLEPTVADHMTPDPFTVDADAPFDEAMEVMTRRNVRHLPVTSNGRLAGILSVRDLLHHRTAHLEELVRRQTEELQERHDALEERDQRMRAHLELAGRVQTELLPAHVPNMPPLAVSVLHRSLDVVCGDSYDFLEIDPDRLGVLIADARGHGVPAAFVSVMARMVFRGVGAAGLSPPAVLRRLNERLPRLIQAEHFITMVYAVIDRGSLRMSYSTAGHPPPLRYCRATGEVERLDATGTMIGVLDDPVFEERTVQLRRGETVLFYTDGVIEARNERGDFFGIDRLMEVVAADGASPADGVTRAVERAVSGFRGSRALEDDVTCVALSVDPRRG